MEVTENKNKVNFNSLVPKNWLSVFLKSRKPEYPDVIALFSCQVEQQKCFLSCYRLNSLLTLTKEL
jgi:hypothetical protein